MPDRRGVGASRRRGRAAREALTDDSWNRIGLTGVWQA
jgi:hypothetical protein